MKPTALRAQAPAKLILFGEWAVLHGAPAIAVSLKSFFSATKSSLPEPGIRLKHRREIIEIGEESSLQMLPPFWQLAAQILEELEAPKSWREAWQNTELETACQWKLSEGLGTSSALFLCLALLNKRELAEKTPTQIWSSLYPLFRRSFNGSGLDLAAQIFGAPLCFRAGELEEVKMERPAELWVLHTGQKVSSSQWIRERNPSDSFMKTLRASVEDFLKGRDWPKAIEEHRRALEAFGVMNEESLAFFHEGKRAGFLETLKSTGAGGGDALLVWVPSAKTEEFQAAVAQRNWWISPYEWATAPTWTIEEL
jgi:mevalonate kinase